MNHERDPNMDCKQSTKPPVVFSRMPARKGGSPTQKTTRVNDASEMDYTSSLKLCIGQLDVQQFFSQVYFTSDPGASQGTIRWKPGGSRVLPGW